MAFSKLKAHLQSIGARTCDQLIEAIGETCDFFALEECWNFFWGGWLCLMNKRKLWNGQPQGWMC